MPSLIYISAKPSAKGIILYLKEHVNMRHLSPGPLALILFSEYTKEKLANDDSITPPHLPLT